MLHTKYRQYKPPVILRQTLVEEKNFIIPGSYYGDTNPVDFNIKHRVLRPEEKHTDVNIALPEVKEVAIWALKQYTP